MSLNRIFHHSALTCADQDARKSLVVVSDGGGVGCLDFHPGDSSFESYASQLFHIFLKICY